MQPCIDIHCHIMPGVDDGSPDMRTSLKMLQIAASEGIVAVILTPHHKPMHHNVSPEHALYRRDELKEAAGALGIKIRLLTGCEVYYSGETADELANGSIATLAGSRYVLIEFHPADQYSTIRSAVYTVQSQGFMPVLAHVERYQDIAEHPEHVTELRDMGCVIQVNAGSVMGRFGGGAKRFTRGLMDKGLVHIVATDAHDSAHRSPKIADCREYVGKHWGELFANDVFYNNPLRILKHEEIVL